jgi:hypothetical protein
MAVANGRHDVSSCGNSWSSLALACEAPHAYNFFDSRATGWNAVQGRGRIGKLPLQTPAMIHLGEETQDEVFITFDAAKAGVEIENTGSEPLVGLRYFSPDVHGKLPMVGGL